jgi:Core-2/I-Branching enzyme
MRIAYLVLLYKYPGLFKRMFKATYSANNIYLVHVDTKSGPSIREEIQYFVSQYVNVHMMRSYDWIYGGYSAIEIQLRAMQQLLEEPWDFFVNLTGQDFPLKRQDQIRDYLISRRSNNFMHVMDVEREWVAAQFRTRWYFIECKVGSIPLLRRKRVWPLPWRRSYPPQYRQYGGSTWFIGNREFCEYISYDSRVDPLKSFYKHSYIPEEEFFQTAIMHSPFRHTVINDNKRLIEWRNGKIHTFTTADIPVLSSTDAFFARKFDPYFDSRILDYLETNLSLQPHNTQPTMII